MALSSLELANNIVNKLVDFNTNKYQNYNIDQSSRQTLLNNQNKLVNSLFTAMLSGTWSYSFTSVVSSVGSPVMTAKVEVVKPTLITGELAIAQGSIEFPSCPDLSSLSKFFDPIIYHINNTCIYTAPVFGITPITSVSNSGYLYSGSNTSKVDIAINTGNAKVLPSGEVLTAADVLSASLVSSMYSGTNPDAKQAVKDFTDIFSDEFLTYIKDNWSISIASGTAQFTGSVAPSGTASLKGTGIATSL